ncbi:hypothetical protein B9Y10_13600, partial [Acinetobacter baumannii]
HLPKLRLKFGSIRGALHFKSLCNKAFQHGKPIKKAITQVERLIREEKNPELKRITRADQY